LALRPSISRRPCSAPEVGSQPPHRSARADMSMVASLLASVYISCGEPGPNSSESARAFKKRMVSDDDIEELTVGISDLGISDLEPEPDSGSDKENVCRVNSLKSSATKAPRLFRAQVAPPQDLSFTVPDYNTDHTICVAGPHGPLFIDLPEDAKPGEERQYRLGPDSLKVTVPEGAEAGGVVEIEMDGVAIQVAIPEGKAPGDSFEAVPPAVVVLIPTGATPGDILEFPTPDGQQLKVPMPAGLRPGQYFSLHL